ncbi:MAG TPA: hypothetical protein VID27_05920 [Blastocatellia bacterium]|jgi:hypothetical protein
MTNEEMQKAIEFLLEHQARLTASAEQDRQRLLKSEELISMLVQLSKLNDERMDSLEESRRRDEIRLELMEDDHKQDKARMTRLEEAFLTLVDLVKITDERIDSVEESRRRGAERIELAEESRKRDEARLTRVEEGLLTLVDLSQKIGQRLDNTDERLDALITVVEKHIAGGNNGNS